MTDALAPPAGKPVADAGAHELTDASDDHFSDASEGRHSESAGRSTPASPIPVTRVERVDDEPRHGEVPGTPAYQLRTQDAVPDEIEVVPDGQRSRSTSRVSETDRPVVPMSPMSPGGMPIPKTIVEKVDPEHASHGEVPGTAAYEKRMADAVPDEVLKSPVEATSPFKREPTQEPSSRSSSGSDRQRPEAEYLDEVAHVPPLEPATDASKDNPSPVRELLSAATEQEMVSAVSHVDLAGTDSDGVQPVHDDDFDDDFDDFGDDFEQGGEDGQDDFDDFGAVEAAVAPPTLPPDLLAHLPPLDLTTKDTPDEIQTALAPYLKTIFPDFDPSLLGTTPSTRSRPEPLLSDRSASLWAQLVAPPPLQPPDWTRSKIRRLFLVSLGVPVDLDEILPASKQKKLVLPSTRTAQTPSGGSRATAAGRSSSSKDSKSDTKDRPTGHPPPEFDSQTARQLCSLGATALEAFSDKELMDHLSSLESTTAMANALLDYWIKRKESAIGDKEAFEGVIENLVGFMKKSKSKGKR